MSWLLLTTILFGLYDLLIRISSSANSPSVNALFVQSASVMAIVTWFFAANERESISLSSISVPTLGGILIGTALILLFIQLRSPILRSTAILPTTLIGRNIIFVIGSVILFKDTLSLSQILGMILSLSGIYLINR